MFRIIYPDFDRFHCNPFKNGGLRRLVALCVLMVVFVYGLQSILISKSSENMLHQPTVSPSSQGDVFLDNQPSDRSSFIDPDARCQQLSATEPCEEPYFPYRITIGRADKSPQICWNKKHVTLKSTRSGSVTILELSVPDGDVIVERSYSADSPKIFSFILAQLRSARNDSYIVMVTWNGVPFTPSLSNNLKSVGTLINPKFLGLTVDFFLIGQKGLLPGRGISDVQHFNASLPLDRSGCCPPISSSLGSEVDHEFVNSNPGYLGPGQFKLGSFAQNCGMPMRCADEKIDVHVYTGKDHNDPPKLCVNGLYVFENKINNGGRGINIAVVNGPSAEVVRVANYDTWGADSTMLEVFLEDLQPDELAIIFTHDEASTKLSDLSRTIFFELGSSRIHDLKFRASWYMVGQKGIRGFTGYEKLNIGEKTNWAEVIDEKMCITRRLKGYQARPDPLPETRNLRRYKFCQKYQGYGEFCSHEQSLSPLSPAKLADVTLVNSPIYSDLTAVVVIASLSLKNLQMLLETLLGQPGVNQRQVRIATRVHNDTETRELAELFGVFNPTFRVDYNKFMLRAIQETLEDYKPRYLIVIEENTVLSPDFLHYFATMEPLFEIDPSINAIGAWNDNGYIETSGDLGRVYRVEEFPHEGFLMTRTFWEANGLELDSVCCSLRSWEGWFSDKSVVSIIPDVSRIARIPTGELKSLGEHEMFVKRRKFSRQSKIQIDNPFGATKDKYDLNLLSTISDANVVLVNSIESCPSVKMELARLNSSSNALILNERISSSHLFKLRKCVGLFAVEKMGPRGIYNGTLSFTSSESRLIILVTSDSPFHPQQLKT